MPDTLQPGRREEKRDAGAALVLVHFTNSIGRGFIRWPCATLPRGSRGNINAEGSNRGYGGSSSG